jgi:hypothetical protein
MVDVTLNLGSGRGERILVLMTMQSPAGEFNFRVTPAELGGLRSIRDADWAARRCLHIGEPAGAVSRSQGTWSVRRLARASVASAASGTFSRW